MRYSAERIGTRRTSTRRRRRAVKRSSVAFSGSAAEVEAGSSCGELEVLSFSDIVVNGKAVELMVLF